MTVLVFSNILIVIIADGHTGFRYHLANQQLNQFLYFVFSLIFQLFGTLFLLQNWSYHFACNSADVYATLMH